MIKQKWKGDSLLKMIEDDCIDLKYSRMAVGRKISMQECLYHGGELQRLEDVSVMENVGDEQAKSDDTMIESFLNSSFNLCNGDYMDVEDDRFRNSSCAWKDIKIIEAHIQQLRSMIRECLGCDVNDGALNELKLDGLYPCDGYTTMDILEKGMSMDSHWSVDIDGALFMDEQGEYSICFESFLADGLNSDSRMKNLWLGCSAKVCIMEIIHGGGNKI